MPQPLATTLLVISALLVLVGGPAALAVGGVFAGLALVLEFMRFWINGVVDGAPTTEVLVRSGEQAPEEQGRTTLLRG